ncbi:putative malate dehydrogenase (decarboxylating) [Helianthus debilis subsp. tardiflorus]
MVLLNEEKVVPSRYQEPNTSKHMRYLDNGASNHMTGLNEVFAELDEKITGQVRFGDGSKVEIKGRGTILFNCKNGDQFVLPNVYYIPALHSNVISLGQMTEDGYNVGMRQNYLRMYDAKGRLVMKVERSANRLYKILLTPGKPICLAMNLDQEEWVWHARMGHANFGVLQSMARKEMVDGMPYIDHPSKVCEGCLIGKQVRQSFPAESTWRAKEPLQLIHADLCGPITPCSKGVAIYVRRFCMAASSTCSIPRPCIVHKRGADILHDPWFNKDTGFPLTKRDRLGLRGLLPHHVISFEQQYERFMDSYRSLEKNTAGQPDNNVSLAKWRILNRLHDRNETLYYKVLIYNIKDFAPIIYTPTVGLVCQNYSGLFRRPRGMYFSAKDKGEMKSMIYNWPAPEVDMIVLTDGSRILGLGDLGVQGIGIPIGKLDMYVAAAGINPQRVCFFLYKNLNLCALLLAYTNTHSF